MVPTVMVLARDNEIMELLGDLHNTSTIGYEIPVIEEEEEVPEDLGDTTFFMRTFGHPFEFMKK